jgi:hypothetical protein
MRAVLIAGLMLTASATLAAQSPPSPAPEAPSAGMSVAAFLERLGELSQTGPGWTQTPEAAQLFEAISGVGKAYRRDLEARRAAGQAVEACLPSTAEIDSDDLLAHLAGYNPQEARKVTIAEAFAKLVRERFACP